jgi:glycosyltransferase involved in cell wall biosynthesis
MKVSVIIPSLYEVDGDYLKVAVESLRATTDWDIIVVTNGSSVKPNLDHIHGITLHAHTSQQGQCNAVNIGAQLVNPSTDYLFISNSDMYYAPNWKDNLELEHLVFSPNLVEPTNGPGSAEPFINVDGGFTLDEFKQETVDDFVKRKMGALREASETGFNFPLFIRKDVWETIGGYDTKYDPWGSNSDTDLQTKIMYAGITPMRMRDVLVYHFSNKSGTFDGSHQEEWRRNFDYYTEKWGFNRDMLPTNVWYSRDVLPEDESMIKFKAPWGGKYEDTTSR